MLIIVNVSVEVVEPWHYRIVDQSEFSEVKWCQDWPTRHNCPHQLTPPYHAIIITSNLHTLTRNTIIIFKKKIWRKNLRKNSKYFFNAFDWISKKNIYGLFILLILFIWVELKYIFLIEKIFFVDYEQMMISKVWYCWSMLRAARPTRHCCPWLVLHYFTSLLIWNTISGHFTHKTNWQSHKNQK